MRVGLWSAAIRRGVPVRVSRHGATLVERETVARRIVSHPARSPVTDLIADWLSDWSCTLTPYAAVRELLTLLADEGWLIEKAEK